MEKIFNNKTAVVTGGSFGIGRATAILFAARGARVVVADYIEDNETIDTIRKAGGEAIFVKCNVALESEVKKVIDMAVSTYGSVDFAFNNAGVEGVPGLTHEISEEEWDHTLDVNLKGVWLCMKHEIPVMLKQGKGVIVNTASIAGLVGFLNLSPYVASKHAMVGLTKTAALEYAKKGIRVNVVCPGVIKTPMIDRFTGKKKEAEQQYESMEPVGRMGQPEEVAEAVIWLCSDAASFVTGISLPVDGGWIAQ